MKKSLLLAGVAGLMSTGLAQAADMPMDKAEAIEYVKVCSEFGTAFFYIPGTDTCLKIGGYIRSNYRFISNDDDTGAVSTSTDDLTFRARSYTTFDARTATEFGTLRSMIALQGDTTDGGTVSFALDDAYIQFAGITAGYATSFFSYFDAQRKSIEEDYFSTGEKTNVLAYTATFGAGWFATLAIEGLDDRGNDGIAIIEDSNVPEFVGAFGMNADWGNFQVMAAAHQYATASTEFDTGFAVGAGAKVNIPSIGKGSYFLVEGIYADGALSYLDNKARTSTGSAVRDYYAATGDTSTGYSLNANLWVHVSSSLGVSILGSYQSVDSAETAASPNPTAWMIGGDVQYTVTKGLVASAYASYVDRDADAALGAGDRETTEVGMRLQRSF